MKKNAFTLHKKLQLASIDKTFCVLSFSLDDVQIISDNSDC